VLLSDSSLPIKGQQGKAQPCRSAPGHMGDMSHWHGAHGQPTPSQLQSDPLEDCVPSLRGSSSYSTSCPLSNSTKKENEWETSDLPVVTESVRMPLALATRCGAARKPREIDNSTFIQESESTKYEALSQRMERKIELGKPFLFSYLLSAGPISDSSTRQPFHTLNAVPSERHFSGIMMPLGRALQFKG
jgi:hypothetical protein